VDTEATDVLVAYSDLLIRAAIVRCASNINPALLQNELDAQIRRVSVPDLEWHILIGDRDRPYCKKIRDCVVQRRNEMKKYLDAADKRDKDLSKADDLLNTVPPTPESPPSSIIPFVAAPHIQILDYEGILSSLRDIERSVEAAKLMRENRAKILWDEAIKSRDAALNYVKGNQQNISSPTDVYQDNQNAVNSFPEMVRLSNVAIGLATQSAEQNFVYNRDSQVLIQTMNDNITHANNIKAAASATLAQRERDRFEQMQNTRMERSIMR
jgi:hypothetical protein